MTIVVATGNTHKVAELETLFRRYHGPNVRLIPVTDIIADFHPDEIGDTFEANAYIKAEEAYRLTGLPSIADDSGLDRARGVERGHQARAARADDHRIKLMCFHAWFL